MARFTTTWSDDQVSDLKRHFTKGDSFTEIGRVVGKTRAAVGAMCQRLGLKQSPEVVALNQKRLNPTYRRGAKPAADPKRKIAGAVMISAPVDLSAFVDIPETVMRLNERPSDRCAWPVGDPLRPADQLCCGARVAPNPSKAMASYCSEHASVATGNPPRRAIRLGVDPTPTYARNRPIAA